MSSKNGNDGCLLVLIVDVHPQLALEDDLIHLYLDSVVSFANLHLASSEANRLAVIAANHAETRFLYPEVGVNKISDIRQSDGRLELLEYLDQDIRNGLTAMFSSCDKVVQTESLLAGALGRALLYIKRQEDLDALGKKICARILIVKCSSDGGGQYLNYINMYLTAQKMSAPIDACVIGADCGLLQQGADITGGSYHKLDKIRDLLQTLIVLFLPNISSRKKLALPSHQTVDYRAACFCHRNLVDMAHVCSNCLSVYCKAVPLCSTCNALFKTEMPTRKATKKKK